MESSPESVRSFVDDVQVHRAALTGWLRARFPLISDVEDLVQEAMARVWRAMSVATIASPRALLYTTAHHLAIDQVRRRRVVRSETAPEEIEPPVLEEGPTPADATARTQELELLTRAIQALPDRCRQVLTLRKIYGLSQCEIAAQLGIAEHTVEAQVANGMRRCAKFLRRFGFP